MSKLVDLIELLDKLSMMILGFKYKLLIEDLDTIRIKIFVNEKLEESLVLDRSYNSILLTEESLINKYINHV